MAPLRSGGCGFAVLDPDMESPRGCKPAPIRLPTALDGYARGGGGERDHRVDPTGAVATRPAVGGRSGAGLGRRRTRICTRRYVEPRRIGGPELAFRPPPSAGPRHPRRDPMSSAQCLPGLTPTGLPASHLAAYAVQLRDLDQVAAGVIRLGDGRAGHLCWRHLEFGGVFHPFVVALDVIRVEHGRGLALLEERLLVGLGRGVVVALEMQLGAIRLFRRRHSEPAIPPLRNVRLLHEAGDLCVEAQRLVEVVHVNGCQLDLHWFPPVTFAALAASMVSAWARRPEIASSFL